MQHSRRQGTQELPGVHKDRQTYRHFYAEKIKKNQISKELQVILQVYENKAKCQVLDFSDFVIF